MVVDKCPVETASEMTSFRRVRLGTGTITRTRGQMTDYMDRYMAPRRREWAVRHEGRIPTQLHWILSEACAAFASEDGIALGGRADSHLAEGQPWDRCAIALVWHSKQSLWRR